MSQWQTLKDDPGDPMKRKMKFDEMDKTLTIVSEQDNIGEILTMNKAFLNAERKSTALWNGGEYVKVAEIPYEILEKWSIEENINIWRGNDEDKAAIARKLNDGDYANFRTAPGKI
tara:strand:- start:161 stop:508 length:348 start_codon:yes stop_codon:yes gene_type:complete